MDDRDSLIDGKPPPARKLLLVGIPPALYAVLRPARTLALWVLSPADWLVRALSGRTDLPPLWLRRHVGPVRGSDRARVEMATYLATLGLVRPDATVLDIGCGAGAMAEEFERMLGPGGDYLGFDVHTGCVRWAQRHFRHDPRLRFVVSEIDTPYSRRFSTPARDYRFPAEDASVDLAIAKSLFTHLLEAEARHYLAELRRVLAPAGRAAITAFILCAEGRSAPIRPSLFTFSYGAGQVRWMVKAKPTSAVAYDAVLFQSMVIVAGLRVVRTDLGHWPGGGAAPNAQDLVILARADQAQDPVQLTKTAYTEHSFTEVHEQPVERQLTP
jgi:ubiquinone/menaquinone biosynthesis C-methylase UbiE